MLQMRLQGMTYTMIGKEAGISRQRVQQILSPPSEIRKIIVSKAKGRCQRCGIIVGNAGHVHHNGDEVDTYNDIPNLELLCISCHRKSHSDDPRESPSTSATIIRNMIFIHNCLRCGHEWASKSQKPVRCPSCKTPYWNKERRRK